MNWKILHKYVNGNCSEDELRELGEWLREDTANEDFFSTFVEEWYEGKNIEFEEDARESWNKFREEQIASDDGKDAIRETPKKSFASNVTAYRKDDSKKGRGNAFWAYASVAVLLMVVALYFLVQNFSGSGNTDTTELAYQQVRTVEGQRTNLKLSDGTRVFINASSSLRIPKNYGPENRTVYLKGEAFFEVEHDEDNPFTVISYQTVTRDLGTQFNISAYDSSTIEVVVKEGKVSLGAMEGETANKEVTELNPSERANIDRDGQTTVSRIERIEQYVGWTEGKLVFRRSSFPQVKERLERWYDIDIRVEDSETDEILAERTLTATYDNMPLTEVLKVLSISLDVTYERDGRTITFQSQETRMRNRNPATTN